MEVYEKSQTVDPEVRAHVYSLVSAVGGSSTVDDGRYVLGDDALACLKDLARWLRLYDDKTDRFDVKRCLAEANIVQGDLLQILAQWQDEGQDNALRRKIALACLELLVPLTWPLEMKEEQTTVNHHRHLPFLQLAQVDYKRSVLQQDTSKLLRKTVGIALPAMATPRNERRDRDEGIIRLLLYFVRNIAMISQPQALPSQGDENDISRSATIEAFHEQDILQLLLTISSSCEEFTQQDVIVLEILFHLLKGVDPRKLYKEEKQIVDDNTKELRGLLQKEKAMFAGYAKTAPTRHNRFGTMIWVKRGDDKVSTLSGQDTITSEQRTLQKMDSTKQWNKPKYRPKRTEKHGDDLNTTHLDDKARKHLRAFVSDFIDSSFNPLFTNIRRAIEREAERVTESHSRHYFYLTSWFLKAEEARRLASSQPAPSMDGAQETSFAYIAGVLTQENFILLSRNMQRYLDDKAWSDVHACMLAFTQILLTVSAMTESSEDDQDIAENIQNRIFYEETTHDRIVQILRGYREGLQSFGYLDACTEMTHVFLRMLERYSKVNADLQVRSKRRARKKAKAKEGATAEPADQDQDGEDEREAHVTVRERKFEFTKFAARFMTEPCINTFVHLTTYFSDLTLDQLKRCHRFFYRAAFKMERVILLFRVDILALFNRMIKGSSGNGLDSWLARDSEQFKEWEELIKQVFRRCTKKVEERPELMVEMLFSKIPSTLFFLEHGYDMEVVKGKPRPPAELEVKPSLGLDLEKQIGIAVSMLVNQGKLDAVAWVKSVLANAVEERQSWEDEQAARAITEQRQPAEGEEVQQPDDADKPRPPSIIIKPDNDERQLATFKDKHLRLLLTVLAFQRLGASDDPDASWIVPSDLTAEHLSTSLGNIKKTEFDPPVYDDGKSAESFIRTKARNTYEKEASSDEGDSDIDEGLFVPGGPTIHQADHDAQPARKKRKLRRAGEDINEAERQRRLEERRLKDKEKDSRVKSALFVHDSDDESDADKDAEFFRLEEQRRSAVRGVIRNALLKEMTDAGDEEGVGPGKKQKKKKEKRKSVGANKAGRKRRKTLADDDDDDDEQELVIPSEPNEPMVISSRESSEQPDEVSDDDDLGAAMDEEDTPLSSQNRSAGDEQAVTKSAPLAETSGNRGAAPSVDADDDDEDDVMVMAKYGRRGTKNPFLVDSDSE